MLEALRGLIRNPNLIAPLAALYNSLMTRFQVGDFVPPAMPELSERFDASVKWLRSEVPQTGWSLTGHVAERFFVHGV